ncbi:MAG: adenylosuccinate lyase, partial [Tidjanibacter sp.]|nr:adenylosuccinate lyase [Tidjanibacter sp.]
LTVFPEVMLENIYRTRGVIFAQRVMNALIGKGLSREGAYDMVQPIAMRAMGERRDYQELLHESPEVMKYLTGEELDACFTLDYYMKNVDYIYRRAGIKEDSEEER